MARLGEWLKRSAHGDTEAHIVFLAQVLLAPGRSSPNGNKKKKKSRERERREKEKKVVGGSGERVRKRERDNDDSER
jgi:hypothetical protein